MSRVKFDFSDKNYIVTGASSGMGKQITLELAEAGANVLAIARGVSALTELKKSFPDNIEFAAVDVCDYEGLEAAIADFVHNNGKLDGVVHAAGISKLTPIRAFDENEAHSIMDISFWAGIKLLQFCTKIKNINQGASIVFFSSVRSYRADKGSFAYSATKVALRIAVQSAAKELANKRIRVNTVSPGWVNTELTKDQMELHNLEEVNKNHLLGIGEVDDVSGVVLFLLSDRAKWITGTDIVVDGGYLA